jgi:hypothetical protein
VTPRELKKLMRERKRQLREQVAQMPAVRNARRKRWIRRGVISTILLLLLLFIRCDCGEAPLPEPAVADAGVPEKVVKPLKPPPKPKPPPLDGKLAAQPRPAMGPQNPGGPPWLDEFRIQVAARSPRLAQCFTGTERPGSLRWSASVNPQGGTVADQEMEPVGVGIDLTKEQRDCVATVLSKPVYKLTAPGAEGLPDRVGIVIEF